MQMRGREAASWHNPVQASTLMDLLQGLLAYNSPHGCCSERKASSVVVSSDTVLMNIKSLSG